MVKVLSATKQTVVSLTKLKSMTVLAIALIGITVSCSGCCGVSPTGGQQDTSGIGNAVQVIKNTGSDTMVNLALAWAETYMAIHPDIRISVTGGGSGTGIAAMVNGTVDMATASRAMTEDEHAQARANGIQVIEHVVALDAIAVVVNPQNPVRELTIPQLSALYAGRITNWAEVGGTDGPIVLLSRESNSGTYMYFLENVIRYDSSVQDELFSPDTLLLPSSEGISNEVRQNPNAIGYDGLGYVTPDQKTLGIAFSAERPYVAPSEEAVHDGTYPIARPLYIYTSGEPTGVLEAYLDWILGPEGQRLVTALGFVSYVQE